MYGRGIASGRRRWLDFGAGTTAGAALLAVTVATLGGHAPLVAGTSSAVPVRNAVASGTESYADLVSRVAPGVVTVRSSRMAHQTQLPPGADDQLRRFFGPEVPEFRAMPRRQAGLGSGVVVREDGYILTNNHVVEGAEKVRVDFTDGRSLEAQVVGVDRPSDLAVLKVAGKALPTVPLGDSDRSRVGDVVLAIGNPLGVGQTVTMGIVSGKGRATGAAGGAFEDFIQTDAPINQGNSGGALVNLRGELIGINSQILSPVGYNIGIGFAIPSNMAQNVMNQLIAKGRVQRGMLGVTVQGITADLAKSLGLQQVRGAIVTDVNADGPAARSGLVQGDVILALDGQAVDSSNGLRNLVARLDPGSAVTLTVWRDGKEREVRATLGELPSEKTDRDVDPDGSSEGRFGMTVQPLTPDVARELGVQAGQGVLVSEVDPDGRAAEAGVQGGDVIVQVNGKAVTDVAGLKSALVNGGGNKPLLLLINRRGSHLFLTLGQ